MSRTSLFRTTVFRVSLLYAVFYSVLATVVISFIYWSMTVHISAQTDSNLRTEANDLAYLFSGYSVPELTDAIQRYSQIGQPGDRYYLLINPHGIPIAGNLQAWPLSFHVSPGWHAHRLQYKEYQIRGWDRDEDYTVLSYVVELPNRYRLVVAQGLQTVEKLRDYTQGAVLSAIVVTALAALLGGYLLGRGVLRRIDAINSTAGEIISGDLGQRIPIRGRNDEFDELAARLNAMLDRIEHLMLGMRQVTDNVAHDLRSPLTRLRNRLEVMLLESRNEEEYRAAIEQSIQDADDLLKTFNALLSITQAEAGVRRNDWSEVDLSELTRDMAELYEAVAEDRNVEFRCSADPDVRIPGNRHLLAQAVSNLLDNAMKYVSSGCRVELQVTQRNGIPELQISDNGPGIPAADRSRVLERFVRLDTARSTPGNGLGLSLVRAVAQLHDAQLLLEDNHPGLRAILRFPEPTRPRERKT
ncbi:MAG: HAMP domain-containing sensor histidine kinase [Gammaproteobacteria bacterium]